MHIDVGMMKLCKLTWSKPVIKVANLSSYRTLRAKTLPWWLACLSVFYLIRKYNKTPASARHTHSWPQTSTKNVTVVAHTQLWICCSWEYILSKRKGILPSCTKEIENCSSGLSFTAYRASICNSLLWHLCSAQQVLPYISTLSGTDLPQAQLVARMLTAFLYKTIVAVQHRN